MGIDPLPTSTPPLELPERHRSCGRFPLVLISSPRHYFLNTTFVNIESLRKNPEPECVLHVNDAARRGISEGARVVVFNDRGEFTAVARVGEQIREGVAWAPSIWWGKLFPQRHERQCHDVTTRNRHGHRPRVLRQPRGGRARRLSAILHEERIRVRRRGQFSFEKRSTPLQPYPTTLGALKRSPPGRPKGSGGR